MDTNVEMKWPGHDKVVGIDEFVAAVEAAVGSDAVAVALTDLDGFAALNEELGRDAGDLVLDTWSKTLGGSLPTEAIVSRLGGDEYAVALPGASSESALIVFDEIRQHLGEHPVEGVGRTIQATIGVASRPPHAQSLDDLVRCANAALMRGKRDGGGCVALYVEEKMVLKSNYYQRASLDRLSRLAETTSRTEASILREALDEILQKYRGEL